MLDRREFTLDNERKILTAFIISDEFCRAVMPLVREEYFKSDYSKRIFIWIQKYYKIYEKCPELNIQDIFNQERSKLTLTEAELISEFLYNLSEQYKLDVANGYFLNVDFEKQRALDYFRRRSLIITSEEIKRLVDEDLVDDAEAIIREYRKVAQLLSTWVDPLDPDYVARVWELLTQPYESRPDYLFSFPGYLGQFMGPFMREWLVSWLGPMKRGKTFAEIETSFQAALSRLNVAFFSFEMPADNISYLWYKRITNYGRVLSGLDKYPCLDCEKNQRGICDKFRYGKPALLNSSGEKPEFSTGLKYEPCTLCRGTGDYVLATWWQQLPKINSKKARELLAAFKHGLGSRLRIQAFPANSAGIAEIKAGLDRLDYVESFVPDVIVIDYADIITADDKRLIGRDKIDEIWKNMKGLSSSRHALVVTATQAQRETLRTRDVEDYNVGEDIRKFAHVDGMYSLNQTAKEKAQGIMRIGIIGHRHKDFDKREKCLILQNLTYGQPLLDSEKFILKKLDETSD